MSKLITDILKTPSVTEAGGINGLVVIMYQPKTDVYISDLDEQTKSNGCDIV